MRQSAALTPITFLTAQAEHQLEIVAASRRREKTNSSSLILYPSESGVHFLERRQSKGKPHPFLRYISHPIFFRLENRRL